jgi:transposase
MIIKIQKAELLECVSKNMSQREIAEKFSVCREYVRNLFKHYDIPITNRRKNPPISKDILIDENHTNNLTLKEISKKYSRTYRSIKHMFKKYGIEVKNNIIQKNNRNREERVAQAKELYGSLTRYELQKKLNIGQQYINEALKDEPYKFANKSSLEIKICEYLKLLNIDYLTAARTVISPKELDIYIPSKKVAIEVNGLFWHSTNSSRGIDKKYHLQKTQDCEVKGIKLLHFFEDELLEKFDLCKSIISANLGLSEQIYARKCQVREISSSESLSFTNQYHLQGNAVATAHFGLFYDEFLVSVMTFRKNRFSKNSSAWEIIRYCTKNNLRVVGGASKLFSNFISTYSPKEVHSYADRRISNGNVYGKLGFTFSHNTPPNYYYIIGKNRSNRLNWQKKLLDKKLKFYDPNLTEEENMKLNEYYRIYDCGNKLYIWKA